MRFVLPCLALLACGTEEGNAPLTDAGLAICIRDALGFSPKSKISDQGAASLEHLDCPDRGIENLSGLERFENIKTLSLFENKVRDISVLADLDQLEWLELSSNKISDLKPLKDLDGLTRLGLSHNELSDIGPLAGLTGLVWLNLDGNQIRSTGPLENLDALTWLTIEKNQIADDGWLEDTLDAGADVYWERQDAGASGPPPAGASIPIDPMQGMLLLAADEDGPVTLEFVVGDTAYPVMSELSAPLHRLGSEIFLGERHVGSVTDRVADLCPTESSCSLRLGIKMGAPEAYAGLRPEPVVSLALGVSPIPSNAKQSEYGVRDTSLVDYVLASPNQFDAGSCLFMTVTGAIELLLHQHTDLDQMRYDGDTDLSERYLMSAYQDVPRSVLNYWLTDTLYTYNYLGGSMLNRDYPFTAGYVRETSSGLQPCQASDSGAYYSCSYNWFDERPDNWEELLVDTPTVDRTVVFNEPSRSDSAQWNVGLMDDEDVEKIKYLLRTREAPVIVVYNHYLYWHADMIVGYDDSVPTDGCPMVESSMDYFDSEGAGGYTQRIESHMDDIGDCTSQGIFYVRDSIYEGTSDEPEYEYGPGGMTERYSQRIIERSYNWVKYLGNHAFSIHRR